VVLMVALLAAWVLMQRLVKGSLMGAWKQTADVFGGGQQYAPGNTTVTNRHYATISYCADRQDTKEAGEDERTLPVDVVYGARGDAVTQEEVLRTFCSAGGFEPF
jgi:hypothetical protein